MTPIKVSTPSTVAHVAGSGTAPTLKLTASAPLAANVHWYEPVANPIVLRSVSSKVMEPLKEGRVMSSWIYSQELKSMNELESVKPVVKSGAVSTEDPKFPGPLT